MKIFKLALIAACLLPLNAAAVELFTFYAECELALIDTDAGTSTPAGNIGWSIEAMDYGPDGLLYATVEDGCWTHGSADTLAIIDPYALTVTPIGLIDAGGAGFGDVDALAFSPSGQLFAISEATHELITIDLSTGAGTPVGHIVGIPWWRFLGAMDFLPDGRLIVIDMMDAGGGPSLVWEVNPADASAIPIGALGFNSVEGMTVGPDDRIYALAKSMEADEFAELVAVDPTTGAGTFLQHMPLPWPAYPGARDGLAAIPATDVLIDIKPGSYPNCFNINGKGVVPVAILGSPAFDVSLIDETSLAFGGLQVRMRGRKGPLCESEDSNADGFMDLVCHFEDDGSFWSLDGETGRLTGRLFDGTYIEGYDSICLVP